MTYEDTLELLKNTLKLEQEIYNKTIEDSPNYTEAQQTEHTDSDEMSLSSSESLCDNNEFELPL